MNNCTIILFGATGDLSKKKLIPAFYNLFLHNSLKNFFICGVARELISSNEVIERAREYINDLDEECWAKFKQRFIYHQLDLTNAQAYIQLAELLSVNEQKLNLSQNRLLYLAVASTFFCQITQYSVAAGIIKSIENGAYWHRMVFEKPFGHNFQSAQEINSCIKQSLYESQIYRVDHFLSKELVSNIALIRFTNCVFEPLWNNKYIDHVQIILDESIGIEGRGLFYDSFGALADVVQNHMLELLALVAMKPPVQLTGNFIRKARAEVLKQVEVIDGIQGQYEGYLQEPHVANDSTTETAAALCLAINNERWKGTRFYLRTGKKFESKRTIINIKFKEPNCLLLTHCPPPSNWLTINLLSNGKKNNDKFTDNEATFSLNLNAKKPGTFDELIPMAMTFRDKSFHNNFIPDGYELLLLEIIRGEQSVGVGLDEIEYAWKIIDQARSLTLPLEVYKAGALSDNLFEKFENKHHMRFKP